MKKVVFTVISILLALPAIFILVIENFVFTASSMCGRETIQSIGSPDGQSAVIERVANCGATTDYATQLYLVFDRKEEMIMSLKSKQDLAVEWVSDHKIKVSYSIKDPFFYQQEVMIGPIRIEYENQFPGASWDSAALVRSRLYSE